MGCEEFLLFLFGVQFQDQNAKEEMEVDLDESSFSLAVEVHQHERITHCYESLLEILNHVLSWHGLDDEE